MELVIYYNRFIKGLSKVSYSITSLQRKGKNFRWSKECQKSFDNLKKLLTITPVLNVLDPEIEFIICTNSFREVVGIVLMQEIKVIAHESCKLKEHERMYSSYDLELATIVHTLKVWLHYLLRKIFMLMTNHSSLTSSFKQPNLNAHQARWTAFSSEFYFEIKHLKGKEDSVVDTLNRRLHQVYEISYIQVKLSFS